MHVRNTCNLPVVAKHLMCRRGLLSLSSANCFTMVLVTIRLKMSATTIPDAPPSGFWQVNRPSHRRGPRLCETKRIVQLRWALVHMFRSPKEEEKNSSYQRKMGQHHHPKRERSKNKSTNHRGRGERQHHPQEGKERSTTPKKEQGKPRTNQNRRGGTGLLRVVAAFAFFVVSGGLLCRWCPCVCVVGGGPSLET